MHDNNFLEWVVAPRQTYTVTRTGNIINICHGCHVLGFRSITRYSASEGVYHSNGGLQCSIQLTLYPTGRLHHNTRTTIDTRFLGQPHSKTTLTQANRSRQTYGGVRRHLYAHSPRLCNPDPPSIRLPRKG